MNRYHARNLSGLSRLPLLLGALLFAGATAGCDSDEELDCVSEVPVHDPLEVSVPPDLDILVSVELDQSEGEDGGKRRIVAWDCLDSAWWSDVEPHKVVVVYEDLNECEYFEKVRVEYYTCYSHKGSDAPYRDYDEDGLTPSEGDCDDEDATVGDANGDGYGDCLDVDGDGLSVEQGDCDDQDASIGRPDEDGDGTSDCVDDDGDGLDEWAGDCDDTDNTAAFIDADGDGTSDCVDDDKDGYSENEGDCNDHRPAVSPAASELCDGLDSNCDGTVESLEDADEDGFSQCAEGGAIPDCDDQDPARNPGAAELCDGVDNDCDVQVDEDFDADQDGASSCLAPGASTPVDCDDNDPAVRPGITESCDGVDNNCDGLVDDGFDQDGDGFSSCGEVRDCDDNDASINPSATEVCDNGVDEDCDGRSGSTADADGDGFDTCSSPQLDCDDRNAAFYPGAAELCDGMDNDCDGLVDEDALLPGEPDGLVEIEPNDSLEAAMDLGEPINAASLELQGAISSPEDEDWFLFRSLDDNNDFWRIELTLRDLPDGADYVVYLYRADGALLAVSRANQDEQFLYYGGVAGVDNTGDYYARVVSSTGQSSACEPYRLIISAY